MFDTALRGIIDPVLNKAIGTLTKTRLMPNHLTFIGIGLGFVCFVALFFKFYTVALWFLALNRIFDGLDGIFARSLDAKGQQGSSDFGGYLDIVADFIFYNGFVFFFALGAQEYLVPAAFLLFSFVGTGTSFLAYAIFESKHHYKLTKVKAKNRLEKSFYYVGGLTEGGETILCLALICLFPAYFSYIAYIFGALCWITTLTRGRQAFQTLR